jgi:hypothetical protein
VYAPDDPERPFVLGEIENGVVTNIADSHSNEINGAHRRAEIARLGKAASDGA